jgi:hypothetical protein
MVLTGSFTGAREAEACHWPLTRFWSRDSEWVGGIPPPPIYACTGMSWSDLYRIWLQWSILRNFLLFSHAATAPMSQVLLVKFSRSLRHTTHGLIPLNEWSVSCRDLYLTTHTTLTTDVHTSGRSRTCNTSKRAAADWRLRRRGHWDRRSLQLEILFYFFIRLFMKK